jgi:hypothetical protein
MIMNRMVFSGWWAMEQRDFLLPSLPRRTACGVFDKRTAIYGLSLRKFPQLKA